MYAASIQGTLDIHISNIIYIYTNLGVFVYHRATANVQESNIIKMMRMTASDISVSTSRFNGTDAFGYIS